MHVPSESNSLTHVQLNMYMNPNTPKYNLQDLA